MLKIYDNNGKTIDRYTVLFMNEPEQTTRAGTLYRSVSLSYDPTYPTGCAIHGSAIDGAHLGRRISFEKLPYKTRQYLERSELCNPSQASLL